MNSFQASTTTATKADRRREDPAGLGVGILRRTKYTHMSMMLKSSNDFIFGTHRKFKMELLT